MLANGVGAITDLLHGALQLVRRYVELLRPIGHFPTLVDVDPVPIETARLLVSSAIAPSEVVAAPRAFGGPSRPNSAVRARLTRYRGTDVSPVRYVALRVEPSGPRIETPSVLGTQARSRQFERLFIDVAPAPAFARLERSDDRMLRRMEMLGGVLVLGVVAAADVATGPAKAQVHPGVAHLQAFLATVGAGAVGLDRPQMAAGHPRYFFTVSASRSRASDASRPNSRSARRCRKRSQ